MGLAVAAAAQLRESTGPWKAADWKLYVTYEVRETAGIARQQEPVEVSIRLPWRNVRVVRWDKEPEEVISQVLEARPDGAAFQMRILFLATVPARSMVRYRIYWGNREAPEPSYQTPLKVSGESRVGWIVENEHYVADASQRTVQERTEDSGQVRALTLKFAGVTLLRSTGPRMHWAPNFQRAGARSYTGIARWEPVQQIERAKGPLVCETRRAGSHAEYPEIALRAEYRFFAFLPYFLFRSEISVVKPIELFLLRNDEMTMDGFFTHVAWPVGKGDVQAVTFAEREKILEREPIPADAPWVCFFHPEKGYGFGSVRLQFDTRNSNGAPSPLARPYTRISDGEGGGKYWNRRLIHEQNTTVPAGSRYFEENAYVVFHLRPGAPRDALGEFLEWEAQLRKPLLAELYIPPEATTRKKKRPPR